MRRLVVLAACLICSSPARADAWDDAVAAHLKGDNETAFRLAMELAQQGQARAQDFVGYLYMSGKGVRSDREKAMYWFQLAAGQGDASAQANLCMTLSGSNASDADLEMAVAWCRLSASQGSEAGQVHLASLYQSGRGVEHNAIEAYVWSSLAEKAARHASLRDFAAALRVDALSELTSAERTEADRRIAAWQPTQP